MSSCGFCDATECAGHELVDVTNPAEFWRSLTPHQIRRLLECAPRVAGKWKVTRLTEADKRRGIDAMPASHERPGCAHSHVYSYITHDDRRRWHASLLDENFPTAESAMGATDTQLLNSNWLLDDESEKP
jgi:hypothetical protein